MKASFLKSHTVWLLSALCIMASSANAAQTERKTLRVCSDPNNLPYSNQAEEGFENKIAELLAADLKMDLEYYWFYQRMGFIRNSLKAWDEKQARYKCDLVIGVPAGFDMSDTTGSYYRSTYTIVFSSKGKLADVKTEADFAALSPELRKGLRIGAFAPSPSVDWLEDYDFFDNTKFYKIMSGDASYYPGKIIEQELIQDRLDAVFVWGPIAGYFAKKNPEANLRVIPLKTKAGIRFDYAMSMGLRRREDAWKEKIEKSIEANQQEILTVLQTYKVPLVKGKGTPLPKDND